MQAVRFQITYDCPWPFELEFLKADGSSWSTMGGTRSSQGGRTVIDYSADMRSREEREAFKKDPRVTVRVKFDTTKIAEHVLASPLDPPTKLSLKDGESGKIPFGEDHEIPISVSLVTGGEGTDEWTSWRIEYDLGHLGEPFDVRRVAARNGKFYGSSTIRDTDSRLPELLFILDFLEGVVEGRRSNSRRGKDRIVVQVKASEGSRDGGSVTFKVHVYRIPQLNLESILGGVMIKENWHVGRNPVQIAFVGMARLRQTRMVVGPADQPLISLARRPVQFGPQRRLDIRNAGNVADRRRIHRYRRQFSRADDQMAVRIDKTGQQGRARQIDDFRRGAPMAQNRIIRANGQDGAVGDRQRTGRGLGVLHG